MQKSQADVIRLQESVRLSALLLKQNRSDQGQAQAALVSWLAAFNFQNRGIPNAPDLALTELQPLLTINLAWITVERGALQAIQRAVAAAQAVKSLPLRARGCEDHLSNCRGPARRTFKGQRGHGALTDTLSTLKLDMARDYERLLASTSLRLQIEQQAMVARVWSQLGELSGFRAIRPSVFMCPMVCAA